MLRSPYVHDLIKSSLTIFHDQLILQTKSYYITIMQSEYQQLKLNLFIRSEVYDRTPHESKGKLMWKEMI